MGFGGVFEAKKAGVSGRSVGRARRAITADWFFRVSKNTDRESKRRPIVPRRRFANDASALRTLADLRAYFRERANDEGQDPMRNSGDVIQALVHGLTKDRTLLERLAHAARLMMSTGRRDAAEHSKALSWDGPTAPFPRPGSEGADAGRVMRDG